MDIREDSKKIVQMLLNIAVEQGDLKINFPINYRKITQDLGWASENYCRICFLYLADKRILTPYKDAGIVQLHASAVDFLAEP